MTDVVAATNFDQRLTKPREPLAVDAAHQADGFSVQDVDWDTQDGRYRVRLQGEWVIVPSGLVARD